MTKRRRRKAEPLSRIQIQERALACICDGFGFDRNTISTNHNQTDSSKPYLFAARTKGEAFNNETKMGKALGRDDVIHAGTWVLQEELAASARKLHNRQPVVPPAHQTVEESDPPGRHAAQHNANQTGPPEWPPIPPLKRRRRIRKAPT